MQKKTEEAVNKLNGGLFTAGGLLAGVAGAVAGVVCRRVRRAAADLMSHITSHRTARAHDIIHFRAATIVHTHPYQTETKGTSWLACGASILGTSVSGAPAGAPRSPDAHVHTKLAQ